MKILNNISEDLIAVVNSPVDALEIIRAFELDLAVSQGGAWAVGVNSCTSGLLASLIAVGVGPGDEVIVPSVSWPQTWFPVAFLGATLIPVELSEMWPVMDAELVNRAISEKTKAVVSVGLWGNPAGIREVDSVCKHFGIPHILDAAQLFNSRVDGKGIGSAADLVVLSFGSTKKLACFGEGGGILGEDRGLRDRILAITQHPFRVHSEVEDGDLITDGAAEGFNFNFRIHPLCALIGKSMLMGGLVRGDDIDLESRVAAVLGEHGMKILTPPIDWVPVLPNGTALIVEGIQSNEEAMTALRQDLDSFGVTLREPCYGLLSDLKGFHRRTIFPWTENFRLKIDVRAEDKSFRRTRNWLNKILVLEMHLTPRSSCPTDQLDLFSS